MPTFLELLKDSESGNKLFRLKVYLEKQEKRALVPKKITVHPKEGKPFERTQMVRPEELGEEKEISSEYWDKDSGLKQSDFYKYEYKEPESEYEKEVKDLMSQGKTAVEAREIVSEKENERKNKVFQDSRDKYNIEKHPSANHEYMKPGHQVGHGRKKEWRKESYEKEWFSEAYRMGFGGGVVFPSELYLDLINAEAGFDSGDTIIVDPFTRIIRETKSKKEFTYKDEDELDAYLKGRYEIENADRYIQRHRDILETKNYDPKKEEKYTPTEVKDFNILLAHDKVIMEEKHALMNIRANKRDLTKLTELNEKYYNKIKSLPKGELNRFMKYQVDRANKIIKEETYKGIDEYKFEHGELYFKSMAGLLDFDNAMDFIKWSHEHYKRKRQQRIEYPVNPFVKEIIEFGPTPEIRRGAFKLATKLDKEYGKTTVSLTPRRSYILPSDNIEKAKDRLIDGWLNQEGADEATWLMGTSYKIFNNKNSVQHYWNPNVPGKRIIQNPDNEYLELVKNLYAETQNYFKKKKITEITLYRGIRDGIAINSPLESWTINESTAKDFTYNEGTVMKVTVPIDRVLMSFRSQKNSWAAEKDLRGKKEYTLIGIKDGKSLFDEFRIEMSSHSGYTPGMRRRGYLG